MPDPNAFETPTASGSAQQILTAAQEERFVIEDFRPLVDSLEWDLGQIYLRQRGSKAFTTDARPVPFVINNDGVLSANAAEVLFASLAEAEQAGSLEARIFVLEIGIGVGLFARFFLDHFKSVCVKEGKDYYGRLTYIAADRSEQMLADACRNGVFANHPGRYLIRVVDALAPHACLQNDSLLPSATPFLRAVFSQPARGIAMARAALQLNPRCSSDLWNTLGDAYYELGRLIEARHAYEMALRINAGDVRGCYNLAWVLLREGSYRAALDMIARGLAADETGAYYDRLLKKQAEVLNILSNRNQHRDFLLANRVSTRTGEPAAPQPGPPAPLPGKE